MRWVYWKIQKIFCKIPDNSEFSKIQMKNENKTKRHENTNFHDPRHMRAGGLRCSSIFHPLAIAAIGRQEASSALFQTNDYSSVAIAFTQNCSFICKMGSTDQWTQPFLHTKCVECIGKYKKSLLRWDICSLPKFAKQTGAVKTQPCGDGEQGKTRFVCIFK